jgi:Na+/H+-dicarboxylate symporter
MTGSLGRTGGRTLVLIVLVGVLSAVAGIAVAHAADPRLDEALASLAKAEAQLLASQPGPASPKVQQEFQRHVDRALYLIDRAMEQIEAAKDAVNNP